MDEQLKKDIEDYKKTDWKALLREDKGDHHLKEIKPHLDFIKSFLDTILESLYFESSYLPYLINLQTSFSSFRELETQIKQHTDDNRRQGIIGQVIQCKNSIFESLIPLSNMLRIQAESDPNRHDDDPKKIVEEYKKAIKGLEQELKKSKQIQSQYAEQVIKEEAERYGDFFKKEYESNKRWSWMFGFLFLVFSAVSCFFAYCFLQFDHKIEAEDLVELIIKGDVFNKIFILSIILLVISVIKREYLALRHQFTLNKHRHNAISSHKEILSSIKDTKNESDKEISNAILLELTKSMFSSQETGYVKDQKDSSGSKVVEVSRSVFQKPKD